MPAFMRLPGNVLDAAASGRMRPALPPGTGTRKLTPHWQPASEHWTMMMFQVQDTLDTT
jgi:hypothetical protein